MNDHTSRHSSSSYGEAAYAYDDDYYDARDDQGPCHRGSRHTDQHVDENDQEQDDFEHEGMHQRQHANHGTCNDNDVEDDDYDKDGSDDDDEDSVSNAPSTTRETIALFGATSPTGHHFLRLALDAGYRVRALIPPGAKDASAAAAAATTNAVTSGSVLLENDELYTVIGTLEDIAKVQEVVYSASYVVCMLTEALVSASTTSSSSKQQPAPLQEEQENQENQQPPLPQNSSSHGPLLSFIQRLYPLMLRQDDPVISGFLFQATSLSADGRGVLPVLAKVFRSMHFKRKSEYLQDMDAAISFVQAQHQLRTRTKKVPFPFIVTRPPGVLRDGPSTKKLAASKSQPGPFPYSYVDLAEFSLNALKMKKLFNSCPYVVGDGIY